MFFADHAGAFPTTKMSIPAMLTGVTYRNETPIKDFMANQLAERSLVTTLAKNGYEVDFTTIWGGWFQGPITSKYLLPKPFVSYEDHRRASSAQLFDVSLFRHAPDVLKSLIYNEQEWLLQRQEWFLRNVTSAARIHHASNARAFMNVFIRRMGASRGTPAYKLIPQSLNWGQLC